KTRDFLRAVARVSAQRPVNVGLRGPTGCGKTSLAVWFAAMIEAPAYFVLDMSTLREPTALFGFKEITIDGATGAQPITWHRSGRSGRSLWVAACGRVVGRPAWRSGSPR